MGRGMVGPWKSLPGLLGHCAETVGYKSNSFSVKIEGLAVVNISCMRLVAAVLSFSIYIHGTS